MVRIGKICKLDVVKLTEQGVYLDGGPYGEILLPNRYVPQGCQVNDEIEAFISFDSEDRLLATTDVPLAIVGEFGYLPVVDVNTYGAFLDWGLPKNLFVPFREQAVPMEKGRSYTVYVYVDDKTGRIAASSRFKKYLNLEPFEFHEGDEVSLLIAQHSEMGFLAIINGAWSGLLYHNEIFQPLKLGEKRVGYIKKIREDGKIDLSLEKQGYQKVDPVLEQILVSLRENNGFLPLSDSSDPESIKTELGISKKTFKKAIGALYKSKLIVIEKEGIRLL
ncbi:MAG: GntR family transcriptional regulator [Prolixibacteraceae bacterium]|nr:GntR family transcriptional regulator [Prolixibacteraceae bacterium]